ncbi:beta 1-4 rhamnosyltransferase Cps2T [Paenibacillus sp. GCM10028914]|uniref:beta 1-4 rhamnosyltransferase Cps2T n=1 Tax=Paenibacillus sp. GCM10028914 TaxID=3273416 RepID=UPI003614F714
MKRHVFIIGSKGIPARYGGFETFVDQLTAKRKDSDIKYHVACLAKESGEFEYNHARCFQVKVPSLGSARAVIYDLLSLQECTKYIQKNKLYNSIIYILACRIGPFFYLYKRKLEKMGVQVYVNPDGHEWKRGKWNFAIKQYWKYSEKLMVKHADLLVCDSRGIEEYIQSDYSSYKPKTTFIAYGADVGESSMENDDDILLQWMGQHQVRTNEYYLIIGRFVPENNYELIIREFMKSDTNKDLVIITGFENNKFYRDMLARTRFDQDKRIKFVGTVYNQLLLKKIRELAYGYCHGHEVGGTNPSLLESLASTKLNLLYDVVFNREVGADSSLYFTAEPGSLAQLIHEADRFSSERVAAFEDHAKTRIIQEYAWEKIVDEYESLFIGEELHVHERDYISGWQRNKALPINENHF